MNLNEKKMLDILKSLKDSGAVSVKAEFEAEGTRTEELLRLLDIARKADMKIGLKIGGCEAVRDLIEAKQFGVDYVIAPMVETQYALSKYALAINRVFSPLEQNEVIFLANIETITTYNNFHSMLKVTSESKNTMKGTLLPAASSRRAAAIQMALSVGMALRARLST
jgi:hypothetical protein